MSSANPASDIRETLFGDKPFAQWPNDELPPTGEPWESFVTARKHLEAGEESEAKKTLRAIVATADLESRHYLQAWHFLRSLGEQPPETEAKHVYGVVVEVALEGGLDIVAAYEDHAARYFNYSGAAVIWEHPADLLDEKIDALLAAGRVVAAQIGPWEEPRPPAPNEGQARISMLTPSGLHFGEAPLSALSADPLGGSVIAAAIDLMQALIALTDKEG